MDQADKLRTVSQYNETTIKSSSLRIITVTSGKGGVGKTNTTANIAIQLSRLGKRVIILDADLGLANIELILGVVPKYTLEDIIKGRKSIEEVLTPGPLGIQFISGGSGVNELVKITDYQLSLFIQNISKLEELADIILIDTGAGLSNSVMTFVRAVNEIIIVTTPEPTAIMDAYSLIKVIKNDGGEIPKINVVMNRVDDKIESVEAFNKLSRVSIKFLNIELESLGFVPYDPYLVKSVKRQEPVMILYPKAASSKSFQHIGNRLLNIYDNDKQIGITGFIKRIISNFNV